MPLLRRQAPKGGQVSDEPADTRPPVTDDTREAVARMAVSASPPVRHRSIIPSRTPASRIAVHEFPDVGIQIRTLILEDEDRDIAIARALSDLHASCTHGDDVCCCSGFPAAEASNLVVTHGKCMFCESRTKVAKVHESIGPRRNFELAICEACARAAHLLLSDGS